MKEPTDFNQMTFSVETRRVTFSPCGNYDTITRLKHLFPGTGMSDPMARRSPYSNLPLQRRRSRRPIIATIFVALAALCLVVRMVNSRMQPTPQAANDEFLASLKKATVTVKQDNPTEKVVVAAPQTQAAGTPGAEATQVVKKPAVTLPLIPQAMAADKVREEFEKAATVLRQYFKSPSDDALATLLRHPDQSMPRHRTWSQKSRIMPAVPLRIGPQFGTAGSLLVTPVKMADGSSRLAALEKTEAGYRLDWESFSAWGESRFADLPQVSLEKPTLLRVTVKPSTAVAPVAGALSFTLTHPDERSTLAAYATPDSLSISPAARMLRDGRGGMFTLLATMSATDTKVGWANIHSIVSTGWVTEIAEKE